ncbi:hypothetical protein Poli38472_003729 [Pythium oligandrum]|uniref:Uncharacterized protein n=1 Tax=Pythium oligandrum TaxID=41045 RepID=A0A8K1CLZ1_PYTOL|nr:hypothetical protein Poli38472_003729 [Pythium oligandrum]|eukprot:TMW65964.1 hypothetical protein Poli38472_003729 [Pythium oligandrum]
MRSAWTSPRAMEGDGDYADSASGPTSPVDAVEGVQERFDLSEDALEAHRQVLEMSTTIEILTRDFENLQRELLDAYKKLQEYSAQDPRLGASSPSKSVGTTAKGGIVSNAIAKLRMSGGNERCCSHEGELDEMKRLVIIKDTALKEALDERNDYKMQLERAEVLLRELRDGQPRSSQPTMSRTASFAGIPMGMTSTSPVLFATTQYATQSSGQKELPKRERFDQESTYHRKEDDDLFWQKQYREAVQMRKKPGQTATTMPTNSTAHRASLKIFSYPNNQRQRGITDETVPFTRYIGISTRQNEIIKEQHRLLS